MFILQAITILFLFLLLATQWPAAARQPGRFRSTLLRETTGKRALWLSQRAFRSFRGEAALVTGGAALAILGFGYPAFSGFFIAEDFTYLGLYESAGNHFWTGILTPISHLFFRPSAAAWFLAFYSILPVDAWAYHLRNYATTVTAAALLYLLMRRLVASPVARIAGVAFFAVSKVHLTTLGYINCNDSIMGLIQIEATLYLLIVYFQTRRPLWLLLSCVVYTLEVFSRDYGIVLFAVVATALLVESRRRESPWNFCAAHAAPFAAIAGAYLAIRYAILHAAASGHGVYQMRVDGGAILHRVWIFFGNLFNISLATIEVSGSGSFVTVLHTLAPRLPLPAGPLDAAFVVAAVLVCALVIVVALRADNRCWIPLVWAAVFIGPTFLIANIQMYYVLEPLAGVALLLALAVDAVNRQVATAAVIAVVTATAVNNVAESRAVDVYSWRFCANGAQKVYDQAIRPYEGKPLRSWTLFVPEPRQIGFWAYTLTADDTCPMIPALLHRPGLRVAISTPRPVAPAELTNPATPIYLVVDRRALRVGPLSIRGVVEQGGAVRVNGDNILPTTSVLWNGEPLPTTYDDAARALSATVPPRLAGQAHAEVRLRDAPTGLESPAYAIH